MTSFIKFKYPKARVGYMALLKSRISSQELDSAAYRPLGCDSSQVAASRLRGPPRDALEPGVQSMLGCIEITIWIHRGDIGIMEKKIETTT